MKTVSTLRLLAATVVAASMIIAAPRPAAAETRAVIAGPAGSERFGEYVHVLANGNIVVVDQWFDVSTPLPVTNAGAVFLYDDDTRRLLSAQYSAGLPDRAG